MPEERGHLLVDGGEVDLERRADLEEPATGHHRDLVGQRQRLALVVGDEHGRGAAGAQGPDDGPPGLLPQPRVERGEGLVEQHQARSRRQRPGQRHPLLLAPGELVGEAAGQGARQLDEVEQLGHPGPGAAALAARQAERDVAGDVEVGEQRPLLGDVAEVALARGHGPAVTGDAPAGDPHGAAGGVEEAGHRAEQRRLAAPGRAEDGGDALVDAQVDGVEHHLGAERDREPADVERAHRPSPTESRLSSQVAGTESRISASAYGAAAP